MLSSFSISELFIFRDPAIGPLKHVHIDIRYDFIKSDASNRSVGTDSSLHFVCLLLLLLYQLLVYQWQRTVLNSVSWPGYQHKIVSSGKKLFIFLYLDSVMLLLLIGRCKKRLRAVAEVWVLCCWCGLVTWQMKWKSWCSDKPCLWCEVGQRQDSHGRNALTFNGRQALGLNYRNS